VLIVSSNKFLRVLAAYSLGVFRQSCGSFDIGLLIEKQVVITKIRFVHLSVKILFLKQGLPLLRSTQTRRALRLSLREPGKNITAYARSANRSHWACRAKRNTQSRRRNILAMRERSAFSLQ
jgi:hypothetical protein